MTMPGITIERPKMTRIMYQSLKRHIIRERERKKQEQEHDKEMERQKKEREMRKKKEEEDSLTLEQTKDQISSLEKRLEALKGEKHELFSQLKKVLHQEDENRKRAQIKEHNEMLSMQQQYSSAPVPMYMQAHVQQRSNKYMSGHVPQQPIIPGAKRSRSTSPPPITTMYQHYPSGKYIAASAKPEATYSTVAKSSSFPSTHVTYATQSINLYQPPHIHPGQTPPTQHQAPPPTHQTPPIPHQALPSHQPAPTHLTSSSQHQAPSQPHQAPPSQHHQAPPPQHKAPPTQHQAPPSQHQAPPPQLQAPPHGHQGPPGHQSAPQPHQVGPPSQLPTSQSQGNKYQPSQSAFQTYSTHFAHQPKQMTERMPQGYPVQRIPQPGYMESPHAQGSLTLQQQLEHANQKSGFSEDKFKMQQANIRGVAPLPPQQQAQLLATAQLPSSQSSNQQPPKGSIVTGYPIRTQANTNYQPPTTQSTHSPHATGPRHSYRGPPPARYF